MQLRSSRKIASLFSYNSIINLLTSRQIAEITIATITTISLVNRSLSFPRFFYRPPSWLRKTIVSMSKPPHEQEEPTPSNIRMVDELGYAALESIQRREDEAKLGTNEKDSCRRLIRLEAGPCDEISSLQTVQDIWHKIKKVKEHQSQFGHNVDLYPRVWEETNDYRTKKINHLARNDNNTHTFTVMQLNVLAEGLSAGPDVKTPFPVSSHHSTISKTKDPIIFGGFDKIPHPEVILDFSLRRWRLLEVILSLFHNDEVTNSNDYSAISQLTSWSHSPDILALEEVDRFSGFFQPALAKFGYEGIFAGKPGSPGVALGWYTDGCALFWKKEVFEKVFSCKKSYGAGKQVYMIAILRHRPTGRDVVVAVTHLKAQDSKTTEEIRTLQAKELVKEVTNVAQGLLLRPENNDGRSSNDQNVSTADEVPILLLGDFNAEPYGECREFPRECIPSICGDGNSNTSIAGNECGFFRSAYTYGANSFTTWKSRGNKTIKRVIDYIFHNCQSPSDQSTGNSTGGPAGMCCTHTLSIPTEEDMEPTLLPGFQHPSDHMMIAAKFEIENLNR